MDPELTRLGEMIDPTLQPELLEQIPGYPVPNGVDPESMEVKPTDKEDAPVYIFPSHNRSTKSCLKVLSQSPPPLPSKSTDKAPVSPPSAPSLQLLFCESKPGESTGTIRKDNPTSAPRHKKKYAFSGMKVKQQVIRATTDNEKLHRIRSLLAETPECVKINAFLTRNKDYISPYLFVKGYIKLACRDPQLFAHRYLAYLEGVVDGEYHGQVTEKVNLQAQGHLLLRNLQLLYDRNDETIRIHKEGAERVLVAIETAHDKLYSLINELTPPTGQNLPSVTTSIKPAITPPKSPKTSSFRVTNGEIGIFFSPTYGWSTRCYVAWKTIPDEGLWKGMLKLVKKVPKEQAKLVAPMTMSALFTAYLESDRSLESFLQKLRHYESGSSSELKTNIVKKG